jgi:hypothetical protein
MAHVALHGLGAREKLLGDLAVSATIQYQLCNFLFPSGQRLHASAIGFSGLRSAVDGVSELTKLGLDLLSLLERGYTYVDGPALDQGNT